MTLANCLNLPCRIFKQFACFSDAFKSSLKKKDSVKYFNKPKPCGIFLDALTVPPLLQSTHPPCYFGWHFTAFCFSVFVHLLSVCGFWHINLFVGMFSPLKLFCHLQSTHTHKIIFTYSTNPYVLGIYDNNS